MIEQFTQRLMENLPWVLLISIVAIVMLVFIVWWAAKTWYGLQSLPCQNHDSAIAGHSEKLESLAQTLSSIEGQLKTLLYIMAERPIARRGELLSEDEPTLAQKHSPKMLNGNGREVERIFECGKFVAANKGWLMGQIEEMRPNTALDVEAYSMSVLKLASNDKRFNDIKDRIYNSPAINLVAPSGNTKSVEITLDDVLFVMSLMLRDEYLAEHSGLA